MSSDASTNSGTLILPILGTLVVIVMLILFGYLIQLVKQPQMGMPIGAQAPTHQQLLQMLCDLQQRQLMQQLQSTPYPYQQMGVYGIPQPGGSMVGNDQIAAALGRR